MGSDTLCLTMQRSTILMWLGGGILVLGVLLKYVPGLFSWFGNLPGDIRIEGENSSVFIPITSMIVISVAATVLFNLVGSMFRGR